MGVKTQGSLGSFTPLTSVRTGTSPGATSSRGHYRTVVSPDTWEYVWSPSLGSHGRNRHPVVSVTGEGTYDRTPGDFTEMTGDSELSKSLN